MPPGTVERRKADDAYQTRHSWRDVGRRGFPSKVRFGARLRQAASSEIGMRTRFDDSGFQWSPHAIGVKALRLSMRPRDTGVSR